MTTDTWQPAESEAIDYVRQLYQIEKTPGHDKAIITMGPFTAWCVTGALQLATRHPDIGSINRDLIRDVIGQLRPLFAGTPGERLLELGDDPAHDVPPGA